MALMSWPPRLVWRLEWLSLAPSPQEAGATGTGLTKCARLSMRIQDRTNERGGSFFVSLPFSLSESFLWTLRPPSSDSPASGNRVLLSKLARGPRVVCVFSRNGHSILLVVVVVELVRSPRTRAAPNVTSTLCGTSIGTSKYSSARASRLVSRMYPCCHQDCPGRIIEPFSEKGELIGQRKLKTQRVFSHNVWR